MFWFLDNPLGTQDDSSADRGLRSNSRFSKRNEYRGQVFFLVYEIFSLHLGLESGVEYNWEERLFEKHLHCPLDI